MTVDELLAEINKKEPLASDAPIEAFERDLGVGLPDDYRQFLRACNGGHLGGRIWCNGLAPDGKQVDADINHIYGFRPEFHFSLEQVRECYQGENEIRVPLSLLAIMDDSGGNAVCIGIAGQHLGRVYFWDHELEPDPSEWDGQVETAGNVRLIADTFTAFVAGLGFPPEDA